MPLEVTTFSVGELSTYHRNPRRGAVGMIAESLKARGQYRAIVVNLGRLTGRPLEVLAGNHTLLAAREIGWESIDATTVDVDDAEAARIVAADNRLADLGGYDDADLIEVLETAGELVGTGYSEIDLAALRAAMDEPLSLTDPDEVPDIPKSVPVSVLGDVWQLGPHRLVVGSSGDLRSVAGAVQGPVDCVWTDPLYGINYVGGNHRKTSRARAAAGEMSILNDSIDEALAAWSDALTTVITVARAGAPIYVTVPAGPDQSKFEQVFHGSGVLHRQTLVWVKHRLVLGRSDYHYRHEPILYGFTPGGEGRLGRGGPRWHGDDKQTTVIEAPMPRASKLHPTMKPVELIEPMLRNSCPRGGVVLDPFGGSGSTLIAAHRAGMRATLVELDPRYADVICRRFQEHTGTIPVRDGEQVDFTAGADGDG